MGCEIFSMWQNLGKMMNLSPHGSHCLFLFLKTHNRLFKKDSKKIKLILSVDANEKS